MPFLQTLTNKDKRDKQVFPARYESCSSSMTCVRQNVCTSASIPEAEPVILNWLGAFSAIFLALSVNRHALGAFCFYQTKITALYINA